MAFSGCGSAPSLTNGIIELEHHFGGALFRRKPGVALTALGRAVWPHLKQIAQSADDAREAASTLLDVTRANPTGLSPSESAGGYNARRADIVLIRRIGATSLHQIVDALVARCIGTPRGGRCTLNR